jgi:hypothetical protein
VQRQQGAFAAPAEMDQHREQGDTQQQRQGIAEQRQIAAHLAVQAPLLEGELERLIETVHGQPGFQINHRQRGVEPAAPGQQRQAAGLIP